jgi:hypothetical protein
MRLGFFPRLSAGAFVFFFFVLTIALRAKEPTGTVADGSAGKGGDLIPPDLITRWNPGIPGGIPAVATIYTTMPAAIYGDGKTDATAAINSAIQAAGTIATATNPQVIYLPAGTYRISDSILMNRSYVVLRGAGPGLTKIVGIPGAQQASIRVGWKWDYTGVWYVIGDVPKGSTSLTVSDAKTIEVGDVLQIDQCDDFRYVRIAPDGVLHKRQPTTGMDGPGTGAYPGVTRGPWRSVGQQIEVAAKHGNTLSLSSPTHIAFESVQIPQVFKTATARAGEPGTRYAGIEDLYVSGGTADNITFVNTAYCWVKNIESDGRFLDADHGMSRMHIDLIHAYRCEIRDSYFHHARRINYGNISYGISISNQSSDNLVENNISVHHNKPVIMHASGGGNVIAYNYVDNAYIVNAPGWQESGIDGSHESFSHHDLFEGNWASNLGADGTHGNSGWQTWFRNYAQGRNSSPPSPDTGNVRAVDVAGWSREHTFVGNVLNVEAVNGIPPVYECATDGPSMDTGAVFRIGCGAGADYRDRDDGTSLSHLYRHGNWDSVTKTVIWDPHNPNRLLPPSLYLTKKPAFFGDSPWPWAGPDLKPMVGTLPAKARYDRMQ